MKSMKLRLIAMGLTVLPFIFAGWIFTSWLAGSALAAGERGEVVVIDPPQQFFQIANRLGFKITRSEDISELDMTAITVRVPRGHYPRSAALLLKNYIPELVVDGSSLGFIL